MAKKHEERFESLEQEVSEMKTDLQKLPVMEEKLPAIMKNIEQLRMQGEKQKQQQQTLMKNLDRLTYNTEEEMIEEEYYEQKELNMVELDEEVNVVVELSINSVVGLTNSGVTKGDPNLTKTRVSLKTLVKTWTDSDQGYLVECRALEGPITVNEITVDEETPQVPTKIDRVLVQFKDVFHWLEELPPKRAIEHHIHLQMGTDPINVQPYRHGFQQKAEMERLMDKMLTS
ncbi:ty3-gypsy retroelement transposase [Cucumis melo var. makuwa]|uniref:Ty3-gypsy retroelement transposase n=1 Tax=Cucumis melo var. makuwa TaxID=1194695 RepID=A0A5D3C6Z7_CUCMM|nr:ty3-gypsy retroelement transposase [Cucumis melo var. makuwa]TYK07661.1 ty3-gypsy retroelement transposase [Cucumis melo var. makuwa]